MRLSVALPLWFARGEGMTSQKRMGETLFPRSTKHFTSQSEVFDTPFWASRD